MKKDHQSTSHNASWYEIWMQQNKQFFSLTEKNLKEFFNSETVADPEKNIKQMNAWLDHLKKCYQRPEDQPLFQDHWDKMMSMYREAAELMREEWMKQIREKNTPHSMQDLQNLWLDCCDRAYKKSLASNEFIQATLKWWQTAMS